MLRRVKVACLVYARDVNVTLTIDMSVTGAHISACATYHRAPFNEKERTSTMFSPQDLCTVLSALRVAEDVYRKDAAAMRTADPQQPRIAEQFERQAKDCMRVAAELEEHHG